MKRLPILHPPLFALFPILFFYSRNLGEFRIHALLAPAAQAVILTAAAWVGIGALLKNYRKAAVLLSLFVVEFFSFGHAVTLLDTAQPSLGLSEWASETLLAAVFVAAFLAVAVWSGKWRGRLEAPTKVLNLVAVLLVAVPAASITLYEAKTWRARRQKHRFSHVKLTVTERPPNIYYIILDAYGRSDSLSEFYGFDNTEFVDFLRSKGFYVSGKSTSNYSHTVLSIASSLNFTYIEGLLERVEPGDNIPLHEMTGNSRVAGLLKGAGYRFVSFAGRREIYNADIYMAPPRRSDFERGLLNTTAAASAASQRERDRQAIRHVLEKLPETASMPHPVFVYAHIMSPHPPFVFTESGTDTGARRYFGTGSANHIIRPGAMTRTEYIDACRSQTAYLNTLVRKALEEILDRSATPPVIILQGDHGPGAFLHHESLENTFLADRMSILNAYHLPGGDELLYDSITPVNTFRVVFNRYFDADVPLLEDRNYFSPVDRPSATVEVTEMIGDEADRKRYEVLRGMDYYPEGSATVEGSPAH